MLSSVTGQPVVSAFFFSYLSLPSWVQELLDSNRFFFSYPTSEEMETARFDPSAEASAACSC